MRLIDLYEQDTQSEGTLFLFRMIKQRMEEPNVNISATMPTWEEHLQFIASHPYRAWYLIEWDNATFAGYVSATKRNEIGVVLLREYRGMGIGTKAVEAIMRMLRPLPSIPSERRGTWLANVNPENKASRALFDRLGGKVIQVTYELPG